MTELVPDILGVRGRTVMAVVLAAEMVAALGVVLVVAGVATDRAWPVLVGVAVLAALVAVMVPWHGRSLLARWRVCRQFRSRRRRVVASPQQPADLVPLAQWLPGLAVNQTRSVHGTEIGVVTDGESWSAVLGLAGDDDLVPHLAEPGVLDLGDLTGLTQHDDIVFAGLQVVNLTVPGPARMMLLDESPAAASYASLADDVTPAVRQTWLVVRLDPRVCLEAVSRRGDTDDAIHATLRFGVHRLQAALKRQGIATRALGPMEIYEVLSLCTGAGSGGAGERSRERWNTWECDALEHVGRQVRGFGPDPSAGYSAVLREVAQAPALFAVTSYSFGPGREPSGGVRLVTVGDDGATAACQWLGEHLGAGATADVVPGRGGGVQVPVLLGTVPLGRTIED